MSIIKDADDFRYTFLGAVADREEEKRLNISSSASALDNCDRQQFYVVTGAEKEPSRSPQERGADIIAARMGNAIEPFVEEVLGRIFLDVKDAQCSWAILSCGDISVWHDDALLRIAIADHKKRRLCELSDCKVLMTGHPDGVLYPKLGIKGEVLPIPLPALLETKYMNMNRFSKLSNDGVKEFDMGYYLQAQANMKAMRADNAVFLAFAKDKTAVGWNKKQLGMVGKDPFMYIEFIPFAPEYFEEGLTIAEFLREHVDTKTMPARKYDPTGAGAKSDWHCRWCEFHARCLRDGA